METLNVKSFSFNNGETIPEKYTCDGKNVNPSLEITNVPESTETLLLVLDDPDAPIGTFTHWILMNIPPSENVVIKENLSDGIEGTNDFGDEGYGGPCPPSGSHRYFFKVYALDKKLDLPRTSRRKEIDNAIRGHTIAYGKLMGKYP